MSRFSAWTRSASGSSSVSYTHLDVYKRQFLFVACSEWWLRFLDQKQMIGEWEVPLLRNGFRLVVFSLIIMVVVLFFRQGIMGSRELPDLFRKKTAAKAAGKGAGK